MNCKTDYEFQYSPRISRILSKIWFTVQGPMTLYSLVDDCIVHSDYLFSVRPFLWPSKMCNGDCTINYFLAVNLNPSYREKKTNQLSGIPIFLTRSLLALLRATFSTSPNFAKNIFRHSTRFRK